MGLGLGLGSSSGLGLGYLAHSGGSNKEATEAEPRWHSSRDGEPEAANLVGLERPWAWAEGEPAADLSLVGLGLGLRRRRCGEPAFFLPGDGLRCFNEVEEGTRSSAGGRDVTGPPGTSLRARSDGPAPTTNGTASSTSTRR